MHGYPAQLLAQSCDRPALECPEPFQQAARCLDSGRVGSVEPVDVIGTVARSQQRQQHWRQIHAVNLGFPRRAQAIAGIGFAWSVLALAIGWVAMRRKEVAVYSGQA